MGTRNTQGWACLVSRPNAGKPARLQESPAWARRITTVLYTTIWHYCTPQSHGTTTVHCGHHTTGVRACGHSPPSDRNSQGQTDGTPEPVAPPPFLLPTLSVRGRVHHTTGTTGTTGILPPSDRNSPGQMDGTPEPVEGPRGVLPTLSLGISTGGGLSSGAAHGPRWKRGGDGGCAMVVLNACSFSLGKHDLFPLFIR